MRYLTHGGTRHGQQFRDLARDARRRRPTSGIERDRDPARRARERPAAAHRDHRPRRGVLAAYGRSGDVYRFYELSLLVIRVARSEFTFLADSAARVEVTAGDAPPVPRAGGGPALRRARPGRLLERRDPGAPPDARGLRALRPAPLASRSARPAPDEPPPRTSRPWSRRWRASRAVAHARDRERGRRAPRPARPRWILVTRAPSSPPARASPPPDGGSIRNLALAPAPWTDDFSNPGLQVSALSDRGTSRAAAWFPVARDRRGRAIPARTFLEHLEGRRREAAPSPLRSHSAHFRGFGAVAAPPFGVAALAWAKTGARPSAPSPSISPSARAATSIDFAASPCRAPGRWR